MLETKDIKQPTLFKTANKESKKLHTKLENLINERDNLTQQRATAEQRNKVIPDERYRLKIRLNKTLDKDIRKSLNESITALDKEQEEVQKVLDIDVKQVMMDSFANADLNKLHEKAESEYIAWTKELSDYHKQINKQWNETIKELANVRDHNIYKKSKTKMDDMERYLQK